MFTFFKIAVIFFLIITGFLFVYISIEAHVEVSKKKEKLEAVGSEGVFLATGFALIVVGLFTTLI